MAEKKKETSTTSIILGAVGVSVAVVGLFAWGLYASRVEEHERKKHKKIQKDVQRDFARRKNEILNAISRESSNHFDKQTLTQIYDRFAEMVQNKDHGILNRTEFRNLQKRAHVADERVVESLFRFFDQNVDGSVDFVELVQCLNLLCYGSRSEILRQLFKVYDHDENHFISREELVLMFRSFFDTHDAHDVKRRVDAIFNAADKNMDGSLSLTEFLTLANQPEFEIIVSKNDFVLHFLSLFGLSEQNLHTSPRHSDQRS